MGTTPTLEIQQQKGESMYEIAKENLCSRFSNHEIFIFFF